MINLSPPSPLQVWEAAVLEDAAHPVLARLRTIQSPVSVLEILATMRVAPQQNPHFWPRLIQRAGVARQRINSSNNNSNSSRSTALPKTQVATAAVPRVAPPRLDSLMLAPVAA